VTGTAGASASAEYERRAARREHRIRDKHLVLGALIVALSDELQHVRAGKTGAAGERAVGRRLDKLVADGVEVMHDRRIPGLVANIDHIAVSSSGVYVIDATHHAGMVKVDWEGGLFSPRRYKLLVGRRDCTNLVAGVEKQVELVRAALGRQTRPTAGTGDRGAGVLRCGVAGPLPSRQDQRGSVEGTAQCPQTRPSPGPSEPGSTDVVGVIRGE